ncbi:hypothetical protein OG21DRAFT_79488 [Imleria badia]|nr:hypothetical protein OG21DRAFT_79488 [Imleria badia]
MVKLKFRYVAVLIRWILLGPADEHPPAVPGLPTPPSRSFACFIIRRQFFFPEFCDVTRQNILGNRARRFGSLARSSRKFFTQGCVVSIPPPSLRLTFSGSRFRIIAIFSSTSHTPLDFVLGMSRMLHLW